MSRCGSGRCRSRNQIHRPRAGAALARRSDVNWIDRLRRTGSVPIGELRRSGVVLEPHEAVALVQGLIHDRGAGGVTPPFGPPSLDNVEIGADGSVICRACEITPAVAELAILLQALLPPGAPLPGGLRYAIARALHEVDVPPFDSVEEFSAALARYERGERAAVVGGLLRRTRSSAAHSREAAVDRGRPPQSAADVRRELHEVNRQPYERSPSAKPRARLRLAGRTASQWAGLGSICAVCFVLAVAAGLSWTRRSAPLSPASDVRSARLPSEVSARSLPSDRLAGSLPSEVSARSLPSDRSPRSLPGKGTARPPRGRAAPPAVSQSASVRTPSGAATAPRARRWRPRFSRIRFAFVDDFGSSRR